MTKKHGKNAAPKTAPPFAQHLASLPAADKAALEAFFFDFNAHCLMDKRQKALLKCDFENALLHYAACGVPLETALARLSVQNLGGFYARPPILWYPLDDAAKIYPLSMKHGQMAVFRLSATLTSPVVPELLQAALNFAVKRFPSFATTVKKGFFWHYLDTSKRRFAVEKDNGAPCRPLRIARSGSQSFRVMYYENRISVEYFHILTDGTGGMCFLKTLVAEYLRLCGAEPAYTDGVLDPNEAPDPEEAANEFPRVEKTATASGFMDKPAVQMSGRLSKYRPYRVLHFQMDAARLALTAKGRGASVTAYLLALLLIAGRSATDELGGEMSVQVPVNMRKFYPSKTLRNFSMYCGVRLPVARISSVEGILPEIAAQLAEKAGRDAMCRMANATERMVSLVRYIPLFIKAPAASLGYGFLGDRVFSNTLSNIGVVQMPEPLAGKIASMDFVLGAPHSNRACCGLVTFGGTATLSITKTTADPSFEEKLFALLQADGISVRVEGSCPYED